jgi:hypothetical protein
VVKSTGAAQHFKGQPAQLSALTLGRRRVLSNDLRATNCSSLLLEKNHGPSDNCLLVSAPLCFTPQPRGGDERG